MVNLFLNVTFHIDDLISKDYSHRSRLLGWKPCEFFNFNAGQEATDRPGHETTDWFQIRKEYVKAAYCHPAYITHMQSTL